MFARHIAANFVTFLIVALVGVGGMIVWGKAEFNKEGPLNKETVFVVKSGDRLSGSSGNGVADRLHKAGIISNPVVFRAGARYSDQDGQLKIGDYKIPPGATMAEVLQIVNSGVNRSLIKWQRRKPRFWMRHGPSVHRACRSAARPRH